MAGAVAARDGPVIDSVEKYADIAGHDGFHER